MGWKDRIVKTPEPTAKPTEGDGGWRSRIQPIGEGEAESLVGAVPEKESSTFEDFLNNPITAPLKTAYKGVEYVGKKLDPYTGAPLRAGVEKLAGGDVPGAFNKATDSWAGALRHTFLDEPLPKDDPSMEDLYYKWLIQSGNDPTLSRKSAKIAGPILGAGLDITNMIAPEKQIASEAMRLGSTVAKPLVMAAEGADAAIKFGAKPFLKGAAKTGEFMTGGAMDADRAYSAMRNLSGKELLAPSFYLKGAGETLGKAREAASGVQATGAAKPLGDVSSILSESRTKTPTSPKSKWLINKADALGSGDKPVSVNDIDDYIDSLDQASYTKSGKKAKLGRIYGKAVNDSRKLLADTLKTTEAGADIAGKRGKFGDLMTVSNNDSVISKALKYGTTAGAVAGIGHYIGPAAVAIAYTQPGAWYKTVGLLSLSKDIPLDAIKALRGAYDSKDVGMMRKALNMIPDYAKERLARTALLAPGKVDDNNED